MKVVQIYCDYCHNLITEGLDEFFDVDITMRFHQFPKGWKNAMIDASPQVHAACISRWFDNLMKRNNESDTAPQTRSEPSTSNRQYRPIPSS